MKSIQLSGGNYGGATVQLPEGNTRVAVIDPTGTAWCYDYSRNPEDPERAVFVGCDVAGFDGLQLTPADFVAG